MLILVDVRKPWTALGTTSIRVEAPWRGARMPHRPSLETQREVTSAASALLAHAVHGLPQP
jgi:hypothetical protein